MKILYYALSAVIFSVLTILYTVFREGSLKLEDTYLIELAISSLLAIIAFFLGDLIIKNRK